MSDDVLQSILIEKIAGQDSITVEIRDGKAWLPGSREGSGEPLPLRYPGRSGPFIRSTCIRSVMPEDPHYALALQDCLPDGLLVQEAVVSGRRLSWGDLIEWARQRDPGG
jgi:hypothetical protein